jgi:hypothetical protein
MPTSYGNNDDVDFDQSLSDLKWDFDNGILTLNGYAYKTIQRLELEEIHLDWLACRMEAHKDSLRQAVRTLQKRSLINIEVVREKRKIRFFDCDSKAEDSPTPNSQLPEIPTSQNSDTPIEIEPLNSKQ